MILLVENKNTNRGRDESNRYNILSLCLILPVGLRNLLDLPLET